MTQAHPDPVVIDGRDRSCVRLLLELRAQLVTLPGGTQVHLLATDPAAPLDLAAWCHLTGHTYLGPIATPNGPPAYALLVATNPRTTNAQHPWQPST